jgi:hypothetical protein
VTWWRPASCRSAVRPVPFGDCLLVHVWRALRNSAEDVVCGDPFGGDIEIGLNDREVGDVLQGSLGAAGGALLNLTGRLALSAALLVNGTAIVGELEDRVVEPRKR